MPNLSPLNLAAVNIGKEFMLKHGYIKNDFDVNEWAAPEFLEQAGRELLEEEWKKRTTAKLPATRRTPCLRSRRQRLQFLPAIFGEAGENCLDESEESDQAIPEHACGCSVWGSLIGVTPIISARNGIPIL